MVKNLIPVMVLTMVTAGAQAQVRPASKPRPAAPAAEQAPDALQEAESLLQKRQFAQAEEMLRALMETQGKNPQAWFDLGFAQSHNSKGADAIVAYRKAVELSPKWFEANLNLGLELAKAGNLPEAAVALRAATELKPTVGAQKALSVAWSSLAEVLQDANPKESLTAYLKASDLDPGDSSAVLGAGKMLERTGDLAGAEQQYLKAAGMADSGAVERLVTLYLKQKRLPEAETWLRKYLAANPQSISAEIQLGKVLDAEGKTQDAIAALEAAGGASDPQMARELADLYFQNKQYDAAATLLQVLVEKQPAEAELHWNYGSALKYEHKYSEAEGELLKAIQLKPALVSAYDELAFVAQQNKHYELALRALDVRGKYLPETPATYWLRAVCYDSLRAYRPAAENYKLFLAASNGKSPDQEFQARHRLKAIEPQ